MSETIDVLIIDDSAPTRDGLRIILDGAPGIRVVGEAADPLVARKLLDRLTPDVITLDLLMPRMDGLTFLRRLMAGRPMPVVVVSTLTQEDADLCLEALQVGAVGVIDKVTIPHPRLMQEFARVLVEHVRAAASSRVGQRRGGGRSTAAPIGQDEETCVVYGMSAAAARLGACRQILPLGEIPGALLRAAAGRGITAGRR
jgi:two-component system chemotaxis response regulator CheB